MKKLSLIGIAALIGTLSLLASTALASGHKGGRGIIKTGKCSASSHWKLKAKSDDGRIETEFEVDQNRAGVTWKVTIRDNGARVVNTRATTHAPSGSFSVERRLRDRAGSDRISARATSPSGEVCRASVSV